MGFQILPTNFGGISTTSLLGGPLSSLLSNNNQVQNLIFPADLASNPSMGHAVLIQAYDYTTKLTTKLADTTLTGLQNEFSAIEKAGQKVLTDFTLSNLQTFAGAVGGPGTTVGALTQGVNYERERKTPPLASISLFLPENLNVNYNSSYSDVSLTQELGILGFGGNFLADTSKAQQKDAVTPYGIAAAAYAVDKLNPYIGGTGQLGTLAAQGAGVFVNPQMQLIYKGVALRTFQLEFLMTPKSAAEAKTIQNICDTLTFYSLPGKAGGQDGKSGQFLTPPQIFSIDFKFLGQNGIGGAISSAINSALTNSGLGFLNQTSTSTISNANNAKLFKINDCVLEDVSVDYAPNGWAAYKDGYPVQTRLTLQFKELTMLTKEQFQGSQVASNYNSQQEQSFNSTHSYTLNGGISNDINDR